ncbi:hypothetical protein KUCAC02_019690 [Chaenocephalus aceratus]|uniref:Uncharacterized protein n=1 Tax=Chaenocephalus aceratus TaxID=36190 RepID=A0ACB9VQ66_CHAAC|nr:hypothetical protein KUCAC02_019690 [Chaenocephalus aceratus]
MNGRSGLVGLAVAATAGCGLVAYIIYKEISRIRAQRLVLEARPLLDGAGEAVLLWTLEAQEAEAQQQALVAVQAAVQGLSAEQQLEVRNQLDEVLSCVSSLRSEVAELRGGLQDIAMQIIQDVKKGVEESQRVRRRRHVVHRERTESTGSSSIYFTASQGMASTYETSEGGYSTAYAESDYTDRDTDREGGREPEQESEEDEDQSCATVLTLRQEHSQEEEAEERGLEEEDEEEDEDEKGGLTLLTEVPSGELALLLAQSDVLHTGDARLKADGFRLLLDNRAEYGDSREFLWRLARAYSDMYESTEDKQEKKTYAHQGASGPALALRDDDPMCFYLLGRWCYEVATLDWLEKKAAAALYQTPPTSTLRDALENFLKAEELSPGFSKTVRLYIAKCHKELGNIPEATSWTQLALKMTTNSNDDETSKLEAELQLLTDTKI